MVAAKNGLLHMQAWCKRAGVQIQVRTGTSTGMGAVALVTGVVTGARVAAGLVAAMAALYCVDKTKWFPVEHSTIQAYANIRSFAMGQSIDIWPYRGTG